MAAPELTIDAVDVAAQLAQGVAPNRVHALIRRGANEAWAVAPGPISLGARVPWVLVRAGDLVHIPLVPYQTHQDPGQALLFAITLGLRAGLDTALLPGRDIRRLHLVTGTAVEDLSAGGIATCRFHLGIAILT